ncbi:arylsulfatase [Tunicatimonas pelagia]|uniref:arylsulfatase n=1 Tax=Tunicatimonas pelagia TaxID=931531 RepID=UPI0026653F8B|nr:arylsulfatase [Tunicatimonas pelagia]WKN43512.1 arylsulfatase [Tunicatimonas pelagia]
MRFFFPFLFLSFSFTSFAQTADRPNVLLIITDDQGYGDLGFTGNPHIKTPVLDQLAEESTRLTNFYVSPVCAPTRSSLMTGRYSLRTGVHDTYNGGATMATSEVTIAEMLKNVNYRTGIFGKWHLGDNYPSRPNDQGFDESVIHLSGGMGQVGDFTTHFQKDSSYFDPVLWHNGKQQAYDGYCSDIFAEQAIEFIKQNQSSPFFCYLSFNAPHTPLQVPDKYYQMYKDIDPTAGFDDGRPFPDMSEKDKEDARKVYGMVTNIDDNLRKVFSTLDELNIADNTIVIFMTDNGPQQRRYVAGMRGRKGSVYRGGVRVPFFMRYPAQFSESREIETTTAHLDVLPTLADLCSAQLPKNRMIDGKSWLPLLQGNTVDWGNRPLFFYWTRKYPELYHNIALQQSDYKLVGQTSYNAELSDFELFNVNKDPYEQQNLVDEQPEVAQSLKQQLDQHFYELIQSPNLANPPAVVIGSDAEDPTFLNRNDASGERGIWAQEEVFGKWRVEVAQEGYYDFNFRFLSPVEPGGQMMLETETLVHRLENSNSTEETLTMENVYLPQMKGDLIPFYEIKGRRIFPFWVEIKQTQ